jgi:cytochrome b subunit of formate dehydrogenase
MEHTPRPEKGAPGIRTAPPGGLIAESRTKSWIVLWSSFAFALLQSICTAVIAISGIRVAIGLSALAEAVVGVHGPPTGFHADWIRIPMMLLALVGSVINLYVIWRIRRLRNRPAAQWRRQPVSRQKLRSETLQIVLAIVTLILLAAEYMTHHMIFRFS